MINFGLTMLDNTMALCGVCRAAFGDSMNPSFFFVPSDLEFFISYEKQNFEWRCTQAAHGVAQPRRCPTAMEYRDYQVGLGLIQSEAQAGFYCRIILDNFQPYVAPSTYEPLKIWYGAPMAAIRRAIIALGSLNSCKIPPTIRDKLRTLQDLYSRDSPPICLNERGYTDPSPTTCSVQTPKSGEDSHLFEPSNSAQNQRGQPNCPKICPQGPFSPGEHGQSRMAGDTWILGPMSTSNLAMERYGNLFV